MPNEIQRILNKIFEPFLLTFSPNANHPGTQNNVIITLCFLIASYKDSLRFNGQDAFGSPKLIRGLIDNSWPEGITLRWTMVTRSREG